MFIKPSVTAVHVNRPLTDLTVAIYQDLANFKARSIFPVYGAPHQSDQFYKWPRGVFNRSQMTARAPGTKSKNATLDLETDTFTCKKYSLGVPLADEMLANQDSVLDFQRSSQMFLTYQARLQEEKNFVSNYLTTGQWGLDITGVSSNPSTDELLQWNDANSTPIADVRKYRTQMMATTGYKPNKLVLGQHVYDVLVEHPEIIDRLDRGQTSGPAKATKENLAALFEVDEIVVMNAIENAAAEGATDDHDFIVGKVALLVYSPPSTGLMTPAAGMTFTWKGFTKNDQGVYIRTFRMEEEEAGKTEINAYYVHKLVSPELGIFFDDIVA